MPTASGDQRFTLHATSLGAALAVTSPALAATNG